MTMILCNTFISFIAGQLIYINGIFLPGKRGKSRPTEIEIVSLIITKVNTKSFCFLLDNTGKFFGRQFSPRSFRRPEIERGWIIWYCKVKLLPNTYWIRHFLAGFLQEHAFQRISAVNPTISVEHVFGNIFCVYAINGIADILTRRDNQREGNENHYGYAIVQTKYWRVDLNVAYFD